MNFLPQQEPRRESNRLSVAEIIVLVGLIVLLCIWLPATPRAARIVFGTGHQGTYVVEQIRCPLRCEATSGTFTSDDGQIRRAGVAVYGYLPKRTPPGARLRAQDIGDPDVVHASGSGDWGYPLIGSLVCLVVLGVGTNRWWRRRRGPAGGAPGR